MLGVVGALPRRRRQAIARVSVSALVASLPLLYLSLLRPPPAALAGDTAFWFLMSNCVIAAIVATADDAGTLFFGSSNDDENPRDDRNDHVSSCGQPVVPLAVDDPAVVTMAVDDPAVVTMDGVAVQEEVDRTAAGGNPTDPVAASPFLMQTESGGAANHMHVSVVQRGEQHEAATTIEPANTDKNTTAVMVVRDQGEEDGETASHTRALAEPPETEAEPEPEPWVVAVPKLVTSKSLNDQEVQEEEGADEEWPVALYPRPPDVLPHGKGGKLRRSATDGSKSVAEEKEYWELSDEELNRRVEDFIARFNRQMRLQIEQEAGV